MAYAFAAESTVTPVPSGDPYDADLPTNSAGDLMLLYVDTEGNFLGNVAATDGWAVADGGTQSDSGLRGVSPHYKQSTGGEATAEITTGWPDFSWTSLAVNIDTGGAWDIDNPNHLLVHAGYSDLPSTQQLALYSNAYNPDAWVITIFCEDLTVPTIDQTPGNPVQQAGDYTLTLLEAVNPPSHPALDPFGENPPGNFSVWSFLAGPGFDKSVLFSLDVTTAGSPVRAMFLAGLGFIARQPRWALGRTI